MAKGEGADRLTLRLPAHLSREIEDLAARDRRSKSNKAVLLLEQACKAERAKAAEESNSWQARVEGGPPVGPGPDQDSGIY